LPNNRYRPVCGELLFASLYVINKSLKHLLITFGIGCVVTTYEENGKSRECDYDK
jgi:hypothetical protein